MQSENNWAFSLCAHLWEVLGAGSWTTTSEDVRAHIGAAQVVCSKVREIKWY